LNNKLFCLTGIQLPWQKEKLCVDTGQAPMKSQVPSHHRLLETQRYLNETVYRMDYPMTCLFPVQRKAAIVICQLALVAMLLLVSGCTQPTSQQRMKSPAPVTVTQPDTGHITIVYPGSTETGTLIELEATVTDSTGDAQTKSMGSRLATTPLRFGATVTFNGNFKGNDRVFVTGYFMDGSQKLILETTI
jgi:hypothetical protein